MTSDLNQIGTIVSTRLTLLNDKHIHESQIIFDNQQCEWVGSGSLHQITSAAQPSLNALLDDRTIDAADRLSSLNHNNVNKHGSNLVDDNMIVVKDVLLAIEDETVERTWSAYHVDSQGDLIFTTSSEAMDTTEAKHWHTPSNEREFNRSPQRAL